MKVIKFQIKGISCASCVTNITTNLGKNKHISSVGINLATDQTQISFDEENITEQEITQIIKNTSYGVIKREDHSIQDEERLTKIRNSFPPFFYSWYSFDIHNNGRYFQFSIT